MHVLISIDNFFWSVLSNVDVIIGSKVDVIKIVSSEKIDIEQLRSPGGGVVTVKLMKEKIPRETLDDSLVRRMVESLEDELELKEHCIFAEIPDSKYKICL